MLQFTHGVRASMWLPIVVFLLLVGLLAVSAMFAGEWPTCFRWLETVACAIIRVPTRDKMETQFGRPLWRRYGLAETTPAPCDTCHYTPGIDVQAADRALTYVERVVDRQINKVRGILTFDSILLVAGRTINAPLPSSSYEPYLQASNYCLWLAVLLCLYLFLVQFGEGYSQFRAEFDNTVQLIRKRSILVQLAVGLSAAGFLGIALAGYAAPPRTTAAQPTIVLVQPATVEPGSRIELYEIYFEVNSSVLRLDSVTTLTDALQALRNRPTLHVEVQGYADDTGSASHNLKLSDERAAVVVKWLTDRGIDAQRLVARGYGLVRPASKIPLQLDRVKNRRVNFRQL